MRDFMKPYTLPGGAELRNRIMLAPMTNFSSGEDGRTTEAEREYYRVRSTGVGAVITACANVTPGGQGFPGEIGVDRDDLVDSLGQLADTIHGEGAKAILQIFHGGRMAPPELLPEKESVSASAVPAVREGAAVPRELTGAEIKDIIKAFGDATRRAIRAGYDGVEIHGANTYLIQQFFSPHSNRREDEWGGTLEKRLRFPLAVVHEVQKAAAEAPEGFIVGYRFSPEEKEEPGITMEDTEVLIRRLADEGLDYLHVSVQDFHAGSMRDEQDKRSRVQLVQDVVGETVPVVGVGSMYTPEQVEDAMKGGVPLMAIGRGLIVEPDWIEKVESDREGEIRTSLSVDDREKLVVPEPLWNAIVNTPGWFPVKEHSS
ncbi:NADH-dependent flavin oxidoreductase [Alkalicoccus chagannorensis]|uniref:NADH-dependent flavin oxidoreductase n=1 Tax=Alkalicoccus chagannorensis TaxID=427072 RepID=UPI00041663AF|nr:NADH-dependent flavin oxidoreductase [Alkalicoccus chagannorensis]